MCTGFCLDVYFHFSWGKYLHVGLLSCMVSICFLLNKATTALSRVVVPFYIPPRNIQGMQCFTSWPAQALAILFIFVSLKWVQSFVIVAFSCISLMANAFGLLFYVLIYHLYIFLGEFLFRSLAPLF